MDDGLTPRERDDTPDSETWSDETRELDRLYRQALDALETVENQLDRSLDEAEAAPLDTPPPAEPAGLGEFALATCVAAGAPEAGSVPAGTAPPRPTPRQVLEAALFVGGEPIATKRLAHLLQGEFANEFIEDEVDALNRQYADEGRPYEVRLADGGWELSLRSGFEGVRRRVYGLGPREVKLSQDALEVLSMVAYHQPIGLEEIVALGKPSPGGALRQLLRRELVALERGDSRPKDVKYRTTRRFLELFELESLDDLPLADEIEFK